jgi:Replicative DNA helicase
VGIISLEMNNTEIAARLSSMETDIDFGTIYRNLFKDQQEHERFYNIVANQMSHLPIYISDKTNVDLNEIKAKAHKLRNKKGLDILMVDYLQLVDSTTGNRNYNREQEVSKISRDLKLLAMDMQIPIIVLCQLSRAVTQRKGSARYPQLSDLRESGAIEQNADIVALLHRDWLLEGCQEDENGQSTEHQADLIYAKWRNGAQLHIKLDFEPTKMKFIERGVEHYVPVQLVNYSESKMEQNAF